LTAILVLEIGVPRKKREVVRFKILTAAKMKSALFWDVTSFSSVEVYFGRAIRRHIPHDSTVQRPDFYNFVFSQLLQADIDTEIAFRMIAIYSSQKCRPSTIKWNIYNKEKENEQLW
jgi:hypothetical protein